MERYQQQLADNHTLEVFNHNQLIFSSKGHWLLPLFAFEQFLETYTGERDCLCAHDTAAGKAAALLMTRFGIGRAHINLISELALEYYRQHNIEVSFEHCIDRLQCKTETLLSTMEDESQMYQLLHKRAMESITN
ncbi:MAG: DUF1893 domain-containing protein [Sphaerochaetaceae bacterium]